MTPAIKRSRTIAPTPDSSYVTIPLHVLLNMPSEEYLETHVYYMMYCVGVYLNFSQRVLTLAKMNVCKKGRQIEWGLGMGLRYK